MNSVLEYLFGAASFVPHGYCLLWRPDLVALHAVSDFLIALAYFAIPVGLWYFARSRPDLQFRVLFFLFAAFILFCGLTHLVALITLWLPIYGLQGLVKAATAGISLVAAYALWPVIPKALALPGLASLRVENEHMAQTVEVQRALVSSRTAELVAANRELESFTCAAAHDLRTPLRSINGFSATLAEEYGGRLDQLGLEMLDRIHHASVKMSGLIDDLLHMSQLGRKPLKLVRVDLSDKIKSVARELRAEEPERSVEFIVADGVFVQCDRELMRIALTHLLKNAWKFTSLKAHATIEFGCNRDGGRDWFFIRDDGIGFDMAYAGKLFEPFERLHSPDEFTGNGIGLAVVARIIQRHGGEIKADAAPGRGATISFCLAKEHSKQVQPYERCHSPG
jgi:signal transduction histidine kinase